MKDKIPQFWDKGIQLVDGCTKVSPGCKNCWSEAMTARFNRVPEVLTDGKFNGKVKFNLHLLEKAARRKEPTVYAIWNDLYHEGVTELQIKMALAHMMLSKHHTFLIVTKRIDRLARAGEGKKNVMPFQPHIWHIVTCENQEQADKRIPHLLRIPGKRGIIIEPMLGSVNLNICKAKYLCSYTATFPNKECQSRSLCLEKSIHGIHQVILGPENGPGKRPFDPVWAESVRAQCVAAGVPYYRKDTAQGVLAWRAK